MPNTCKWRKKQDKIEHMEVLQRMNCKENYGKFGCYWHWPYYCYKVWSQKNEELGDRQPRCHVPAVKDRVSERWERISIEKWRRDPLLVLVSCAKLTTSFLMISMVEPPEIVNMFPLMAKWTLQMCMVHLKVSRWGNYPGLS